MRILAGSGGKWLTFEWLPSYFLVAVIVPLSFLWPVPPNSLLDAIKHVLGAGDLLAVNLCLLCTTAVSSVERKSGYSTGREEDYAVPFQLVFVAFASCVAYAVMKTVPADASTPGRAYSYALLTAAMSCWTISLILIHKAKE